VVGLGGGHGLAATLTAARGYAGALDAVVSVADDGGSSGRLRRDLGIPAPGDVRRCLLALAADPQSVWARAFAERFDRGDVAGHSLGNLVIAGLVSATGSFGTAVHEAGRMLDACGRVFPATVGPVVLTATINGRRHAGQTAVESSAGGVSDIALEPPDAAAPADALQAIAAADQIVLGPGSLFTSVLAVTQVPAIKEAVAARRGHVVFVCNLKASKETVGYDVAAHVDALLRHGVEPDVVLADPTAIAVGRVPGAARVVEAQLAQPDGWSHDVDLLASALARLVCQDWHGRRQQ
jgi:uncharacterized cofD-like protein